MSRRAAKPMLTVEGEREFEWYRRYLVEDQNLSFDTVRVQTPHWAR